jgi:hypothetical protein
MLATPGMMDKFRTANQKVYLFLKLMCQKYLEYGCPFSKDQPFTEVELVRFFAQQQAGRIEHKSWK